MTYLLEITLSLLIILLSFLVYRCFVKPYQTYKFYSKVLSANYKTFISPFTLIGHWSYSIMAHDQKKHNDCHYTFKNVYPNYQVILSNFRSSVSIDLVDPDLIKQFYQKILEGFYVKGQSLNQSFRDVIGTGLLLSEGNQWKMKKKIMSHVFNYDFIKSKINSIVQISEDQINNFQSKSTNDQKSKQVPMIVSHLLQAIFGTVVIKCFFGDIELKKIEGMDIFDLLNNTFAKNTSRAFSIPSLLFGPKFFKLGLRSIDRELNREIDMFKKYSFDTIKAKVEQIENSSNKSEDKQEHSGVIDYLVKQHKLKETCEESLKETRDFYTFQDLVDEFSTFFMAGSDTTTSMMTALIYLLANNPRVQKKVREQIETVLNNKKQNITFENLKKMSYLENVQKETLRMHAPVAGIFIRVATKDHMLGNIPVVKGTYVYLKSKSNHYKQENYEKPFEFNPERWEAIDSTKMKPYSYFPFSGGQRNCIGQHLSMLEGKIALIMILLRYKSIKLEKKEFKFVQKILFAPEDMVTTFEKSD